MKKHIPNSITLGNLLLGLLGIIQIFQGNYTTAILLCLGGMFLDFFDGLAARLLGVSGELGKQLDSLADVVSFGVFPGLLFWHIGYYYFEVGIMAYSGLFITLMSAYRLAKFNIDTRQTDQFLGMPTPAGMLFISSIVWVAITQKGSFWYELLYQSLFYPVMALLIGGLLVSEIPLLALKFKNYKIKDNAFRYSLIGGVALLILILGIKSVPFIIPLYLVLSVFSNVVKR
ncbi:MAG: CDP-diacylglycerol--serine O-phosphatidyltransferase [Schleiferiaceae bacterium]|nr:CDP-diacylglycerol--serine O-phosphatidyltransferase [Schleiferiaceae bacterium]